MIITPGTVRQALNLISSRPPLTNYTEELMSLVPAALCLFAISFMVLILITVKQDKKLDQAMRTVDILSSEKRRLLQTNEQLLRERYEGTQHRQMLSLRQFPKTTSRAGAAE